MKTLQRYLLRQVVATLLMTAAVFTFVLLLGNVLREMLPLLLSQNASLGLIARALGLLVPFVWVFALPMGMLTATLLVFGRFSADQELTAARASGVSLVSLVAPILILSLALCAVSAVVNLEIAPRCRVAYNSLRFSLQSALMDIQLPEGRPIYDFPGHIIYVGRNRKHNLERIYVLKMKNETNLELAVFAPTGRLETDPAKQQTVLHLSNAVFTAEGLSSLPPVGNATYPLDLSTSRKVMGQPGISDMTFAELQRQLRTLQQRLPLPLSTERFPAEALQNAKRALQKQRSDIAEPIRVQIHRRVSFSFACFGFTLLGIPLGIRLHRRETNVGIAVALGLVAVYYGLVVVAESLSNRPELAPHLLMWLPSFLFQAVGAVLLWRANRGV